jgi:hypothetical protein
MESVLHGREASMLGPWTDILMIGGASILVSLAYWLFVDPTISTSNIAFVAFNLSFIINYPHFLASYQLLYGDYKKHILTQKPFLWAAVVSPILVAGAIAAGIYSENLHVLAFLVQGMFLTVGWHYVKQIYGVSLVASAIQKRYFGKWEKNFILLNLYAVWAMNFVAANLAISKNELDGIYYFTLGLPEWALTVAYVATGVTFLIAVGIMVRKYIETGVRPANASLVGFASIYFWYLPTMGHPLFFFLIPFFHSLQYMLFIITLKKNQASAEADKEYSGIKQRKVFMKKFWGFMVLSAILGALAFELVPHALDKNMPITVAFNNPILWFFAFNLFINLHHYFIDNVIWRGNNELVKQHIVIASQEKAYV